MKYLILFLVVLIGVTKVTIHSKLTRDMLKNTTDFALYNTVVFFGIGAFSIAQNGIYAPNRMLLIYALIYGFFAFMFLLCYTIALKTGPISLSVLLSNYSVGFTVLLGVLYYYERLSVVNLIGFAFLVASLLLSADLKNAIHQKMTLKWLLAAMAAMLCNAFSCITMTLFGNTYVAESS